MVDEGIMALPQGAAMQGEEAQNQQPSVTSAQSYDAAQTALGMVNPAGQEMLRASIRENLADEQMSPQELEMLITAVEMLSQDPRGYPATRQQLIDNDYIDPEDLPEQYDPEFLGAILSVLNEMQIMQGEGAMEPMQMSPTIEGLPPMGMAEGGLADVASYLASRGRNGDTMLAHITPEEAALLKRRGGSGTINPETGLPEFFLKKLWGGVKKVFKSAVNVVKKVLKSPVGRIFATIALAMVLGPAGVGLSLGTAAGVASAGVTLAGGGSIKEALVAGAMGYIGGGGTIMGASPVSAVGGYLPGAAGSALNTGLSTGLIGAGIGKVSGMSTEDALRMGVTSGASAAAMQGIQNSQGAPAQGDASAQMAQAETGAPGPIGDAQSLLASQDPGDGFKMPAMGQSSGFDAQGNFTGDYSLGGASPAPAAGSFSGDYSLGGASPAAAGTYGAPGMGGSPGMGLRMGTSSAGLQPGVSPLADASGGANYGMASTVTPPTQGFFDKMATGAKDVYNEYLSPSRPGLPADAGLLRKYAPLAFAVNAAAGGMEGSPAEENPAFDQAYTGTDYLRDNPDQFRGGLDFGYRTPATPRSPVVQTDFSRATLMGQPGQALPMGATMSPGGVAQPYNVAGLYGVPTIYPVGRAKGGEMSMREFPRKNGPINGPGTGTSDDIPAMLSDGEFVFTAKAVRNAGKGSRRKGAARMYKLMKMLEGGPVKGK
jgi:hypothetical protein